VNAAETIQAAIDKLEADRKETSDWKYRIGMRQITTLEQSVAVGVERSDGERIMRWHRIIDPQLAILRYAQADYRGWYGPNGYEDGDGDAEPYFVWVLNLARAILGEVSE